MLRLLDQDAARLDLAALGMSDATLAAIDRLIREPHGILLVTGPTGSGKTTTLYAALSRLPRGSVNMMTVEDPIEYALDGVAQTPVNPRIELTFARALRAILRQDPDIVMIGEIRDLETAQIAVQASLTGHLVLATLHTNDAASAVTRLADMGVEPYLLSSSLLGVLAQRLVRTLCPACREQCRAAPGERELLARMGLPALSALYEPRGCEACNDTGYRGRTGIYELIVVDEALRRSIHDRAPEAVLRDAAPRRRRRRRCARTARAGSPTARRRWPSWCASRATSIAQCRRSATRPSMRRAGWPRLARRRERARRARPVACAGADADRRRRDARLRRARRDAPVRERRHAADPAVGDAHAIRHAARPGAVRGRRAGRFAARREARRRRCGRTSRPANRFPASLARFPRTFSPLYRALVAAGADSGRLADVLARLADYLEARQALRQKLTVALIYPVLVTLVAFGVIAVLLVYVVPQVVSVYQQSRQTLPWLTRALIASSEFLRATGWAWLAAAIAVPLVVVVGEPASRRSRRRLHALLLRDAGGRSRSSPTLDTARFASTLAILAGSGTPLLRALDAAADVMRMKPLADAARSAAALVREGVPLARALKDQRVFPPVLVHLVANGEQTGRLAGDAGPRGGGARAHRGDAARLARGAAAARADRRHGRDRAGARARRDAADRVDEPADPMIARLLRSPRSRRAWLRRARSDLPLKFDPKRDAAQDLAVALQLAKAQGKRVLVDVGGEWCVVVPHHGPLLRRQRRRRARCATRNYVWVKVNWSKENKNEALLSKWPKIDGYPHLFVLDADGRLAALAGHEPARGRKGLRRGEVRRVPASNGDSATR